MQKTIKYLFLFALLTASICSQEIGTVDVYAIEDGQVKWYFLTNDLNPWGLNDVQVVIENIDTKHGEIWEGEVNPREPGIKSSDSITPGRWEIRVLTLDNRLLGKSDVFVVK